eukprot:jgi/Mesvir1/17474/Mv08748-RA.1
MLEPNCLRPYGCSEIAATWRASQLSRIVTHTNFRSATFLITPQTRHPRGLGKPRNQKVWAIIRNHSTAASDARWRGNVRLARDGPALAPVDRWLQLPGVFLTGLVFHVAAALQAARIPVLLRVDLLTVSTPVAVGFSAVALAVAFFFSVKFAGLNNGHSRSGDDDQSRWRPIDTPEWSRRPAETTEELQSGESPRVRNKYEPWSTSLIITWAANAQKALDPANEEEIQEYLETLGRRGGGGNVPEYLSPAWTAEMLCDEVFSGRSKQSRWRLVAAAVEPLVRAHPSQRDLAPGQRPLEVTSNRLMHHFSRIEKAYQELYLEPLLGLSTKKKGAARRGSRASRHGNMDHAAARSTFVKKHGEAVFDVYHRAFGAGAEVSAADDAKAGGKGCGTKIVKGFGAGAAAVEARERREPATRTEATEATEKPTHQELNGHHSPWPAGGEDATSAGHAEVTCDVTATGTGGAAQSAVPEVSAPPGSASDNGDITPTAAAAEDMVAKRHARSLSPPHQKTQAAITVAYAFNKLYSLVLGLQAIHAAEALLSQQVRDHNNLNLLGRATCLVIDIQRLTIVVDGPLVNDMKHNEFFNQSSYKPLQQDQQHASYGQDTCTKAGRLSTKSASSHGCPRENEDFGRAGRYQLHHQLPANCQPSNLNLFVQPVTQLAAGGTVAAINAPRQEARNRMSDASSKIREPSARTRCLCWVDVSREAMCKVLVRIYALLGVLLLLNCPDLTALPVPKSQASVSRSTPGSYAASKAPVGSSRFASTAVSSVHKQSPTGIPLAPARLGTTASKVLSSAPQTPRLGNHTPRRPQITTKGGKPAPKPWSLSQAPGGSPKAATSPLSSKSPAPPPRANQATPALKIASTPASPVRAPAFPPARSAAVAPKRPAATAGSPWITGAHRQPHLGIVHGLNLGRLGAARRKAAKEASAISKNRRGFYGAVAPSPSPSPSPSLSPLSLPPSHPGPGGPGNPPSLGSSASGPGGSSGGAGGVTAASGTSGGIEASGAGQPSGGAGAASSGPGGGLGAAGLRAGVGAGIMGSLGGRKDPGRIPVATPKVAVGNTGRGTTYWGDDARAEEDREEDKENAEEPEEGSDEEDEAGRVASGSSGAAPARLPPPARGTQGSKGPPQGKGRGGGGSVGARRVPAASAGANRRGASRKPPPRGGKGAGAKGAAGRGNVRGGGDQHERGSDVRSLLARVYPNIPRPASGKCPVLWQGDRNCQKPTPLPGWCLLPMQAVDAPELFKLARSRNQRTSSGKVNGAHFAADLPTSQYPPDFRLDQFIISRENRLVMNNRAHARLAPEARLLKDKDLPKMFDFTSCAVVGSSDSLKKGMRGKEIDEHSVVIRFNRAPTKGFEQFAGSKTSLRLQNPERMGECTDKELLMIKGYSISANKNSHCNFAVISPQFNEYTKYLWAVHPMKGFHPPVVDHIPRTKMSTGFTGIVLALHLCHKVDIYGFSQGTGYYYPKRPTHGLTAWSDRHPWEVETSCLRMLTTQLRDSVRWVS